MERHFTRQVLNQPTSRLLGRPVIILTRPVASNKFVLLKLESLSTMRNSSSFYIKRLK